MLPLAHVYVSTKLTKSKDPLLVFGSVLPDIAATSGGIILRDKVHDSPQEFKKHIEKYYPSLSLLSRGIELHVSKGKGLDYYSDDGQIGYAMIEGRKLIDPVKELTGTENDKNALIWAHNFIEAGVDLNLSEKNPKILEIYSEALEEINLDLISDCLSDYLGVEKQKIYQELTKFVDFISPQNLSALENLVNNFIIPLAELTIDKEINRDKALEILKKAKKITAESYLNFLNEAVKEMKNDFTEL